MIEIRRILCPVDYSEHSRRALDYAIGIARWYGATVTLFHVASLTPEAAVASGAVDLVLPLDAIAPALNAIVHGLPCPLPS